MKKLKKLVEIQNRLSREKIAGFNPPINPEEVNKIEKLVNESLNEEFQELYCFANGQTEDGKGLLFGQRFMTSKEIIKQLEFSLTLVKPEKKILTNKEVSEKLLKRIIHFYLEKAPQHDLFGLKKAWFKIEFSCGLDSYSGPYLYLTKNTKAKERKTFDIDFNEYKTLSPIIQELYELEKNSYNWDELEFVVYSNGNFDCNRKVYAFDNQIAFTSTPPNAIKKKYFHYKWLPIFSDSSGNYIGIDLDPEIKGTKGQIINFGRDEAHMIVLANTLADFLDFLIIEVNKPTNSLINSSNHLHDILKNLKNNIT